MSPSDLPSFPKTRPVRPGAHLRVVAPAGPFDLDNFNQGIDWLKQRYAVTFSEEIFSKSGYLAGTDQRRQDELNGAIRDDSVDAILCARGGYGCTRLLPGIDQGAIRLANKTIIGFSDITALHALWAINGVRSIHAPMAVALGTAPDCLRMAWVASVENQEETSRWILEVIHPVAHTVRGRFFGGNLAVLSSLVGTPYFPPLDRCILFLEDVGERPYRIDRMLTTLRLAGCFDLIGGLVLGTFTECEPGPDGVTVDHVFESHFCGAPFPVLRGLPAGHITENQPISFGGVATIDQEGGFTLVH